MLNVKYLKEGRRELFRNWGRTTYIAEDGPCSRRASLGPEQTTPPKEVVDTQDALGARRQEGRREGIEVEQASRYNLSQSGRQIGDQA